MPEPKLALSQADPELRNLLVLENINNLSGWALLCLPLPTSLSLLLQYLFDKLAHRAIVSVCSLSQNYHKHVSSSIPGQSSDQ